METEPLLATDPIASTRLPATASAFADVALAQVVARINSPSAQLDLVGVRSRGAERARLRPPGPTLDKVQDLTTPGAVPLRARLYRPAATSIPLLVWMHGGGWTVGSIETHDRICRRLASGSGCAVLSVDYRLAPEHPAPAAIEDTVAALVWACGHPPELGAVGHVGVGGDSAGGALAALACLRLKGRHAEPRLLVLAYANTDLAAAGGSMDEKRALWGLDVSGIEFFNSQWVPDRAAWTSAEFSPLRAQSVEGLPAALIVTAEHDPLRDQGEQFAARLVEARVPVELRREARQVHNFLMYDTESAACAEAGDRLAADIGRLMLRP